ncbi:MAG: hypothetical protein Fur0021_30050 [Candidatus Promineifilaceae bacterium]
MKKRIVLFTLVIISICLLLYGIVPSLSFPARANTVSCVPGALSQVTVDALRPHRVNNGAQTTFVVEVTNPGPGMAAGAISVIPDAADWSATVANVDSGFSPLGTPAPTLLFAGLDVGQTRKFVVTASPNVTLPQGEQAVFQVDVNLNNGVTGCVELSAVINDTPKVVLVGIDGFSPKYLNIGRDGNLNPAPGNQLTPNLNVFKNQAAWFPAGRSSLPSGTDMNVFAALSGSWPGTAGIPYVGVYFRGWDANGYPVSGDITSEDLRFGPDGDHALSIFDVAQDPSYGGDPEIFTAFISGKFQLDNLLRTNETTVVDLLTDGVLRTDYMSEPQPYLLGDPPSDPNRDTDRDGINQYPPEEYRMHSYGVGNAGDNPTNNPEDRWIALNALRIINVEDPDVMVIHFASVDKIQHGAGAANYPSEWSDNGTPDVMWDDINIYNPNANREPTLDVVFEADAMSGLVLKRLVQRGLADKAYVVIYSDHSGVTYMNHDLPLATIVAQAGLGPLVRRYGGAAELGNIFLWDPNDAPLVAAALEAYTTVHPITGETVHPFVVLTQDEMASGVDNVIGQFARPGDGKRGELYSEWLIEYPVEDNSKVVWPDLIIFAQERYEIIVPNVNYPVVGGHSGQTTASLLLMMRGPGIENGVYTEGDTSLVDIMPTLYELLGWDPPKNVDGRVLTEALAEP